MQLRYTSVLFSTVVLHAHYASDDAVHFLMLVTLVTSLLFHSHKGELTRDVSAVLWVDRFFAVANFMYFSVASTLYVTVYAPLFSVFMALLYYYRLQSDSTTLHAWFHVFAATGANLYLWWY